MIGRSIRGRILVSPREGRTSHIIREKQNKKHVEEADFVDRFQKLSFDAPHVTRLITHQDVIKGLYFQKRDYWKKAAYPKKQQQDFLHLNEKGAIKEEILEVRKAFLKKHGMLEDRFIYEGRLVYGNFHLYDKDQKDELDRTNLERMLNGLCPIDRSGKHLVVLHHFDQSMGGPWIVLTEAFHCNYSAKLHSEVRVADAVNQDFNVQRRAYWRYEAQRLETQTVRPKL